MPCDDWSALLERYRRAVLAYSQAVSGLGFSPGPYFDKSWQLAEKERAEVGLSRAALLNHEHEHACLMRAAAARTAAPGSQDTDELVLGDQGQSGG